LEAKRFLGKVKFQIVDLQVSIVNCWNWQATLHLSLSTLNRTETVMVRERRRVFLDCG
jgi:hypothetical protein